MLTIQNLNLDVKHKQILNDITINFEQGYVYGIIGPNGVGKSTLFKSILGITRYRGKVSIDDKPVKDAEIGKLIEYPNFYKKLTVAQNLQLYAKYINVADSAVSRVLKQVNLIYARNKPFDDLSLGMKQRLGIARALMGNDRILLLDEPQNGLDPLGIKSVRDLLNDPCIRKNKVTLLASHNLNEVGKIVDKIVFINNGQLVCQINNQTDSNYYVYKRPNKISIPEQLHWKVSKIEGSQYLLSTLDNSQMIKVFPELKQNYFGNITNLEKLFDFVITGEVDDNVNID
mgnify:CR=1 FL=1|jgi:ABC-type multidrug transport system ATPase subunit